MTPGAKLDIKRGNGNALESLGIVLYNIGQLLKHPEEIGEVFGTALAVNADSTALAVGSQGADSILTITFDSSITTFDSGSTTVADYIKDSGTVYVYDLMNNPYASIDNPSVFAYTQKLIGPNLDTGFNFGAELAISADFLAVGVINDYEIVPGGGTIYSYLNTNQKSGWDLIRYKQSTVDIGAINAAFLYDSQSNAIINYLDYLNPAKGKLLGIVDQELDYKEIIDPASYNQTTRSDKILNQSYYWTNQHVGRTWWDLSVASFIDYEQDTLVYRTKNWGKLFPGSQIKIYEWVESSVLPSQYVASGLNGVPRHSDNSAYTSVAIVDPVTGIINQKYYYWVGEKTVVDSLAAKRTLSVKSLETYIANPKDQGIPYVALLSPNSVAIFNSNDFLRNKKIILHIDLGKDRTNNLIHSEFQLLQQDNPTQTWPVKIIDKLRDSLVGFDYLGAIVPDTTLNVQDRYGLSFKPRQSMFINRLSAIATYVKTLNDLLYKQPILLTTTPSTLYAEDPVPTTGFDASLDAFTQLSYLDPTTFGDGYRVLIPYNSDYNNRWTLYKFNATVGEFQIEKIQAYKTTLFWDAFDWYATDFDKGSKIDYIVNTYGDIQTLTLSTDNLIKVVDNGNGQWLIYKVLSNGTLDLKGAQNSTLAIKSNTYDVTQGSGFESTVFDGTDFDPIIGQEFVKIFDSVYREILVKDLALQFNQLFFSVINYLFTEQKAPDWIFKTSFVDVYHNLRKLEQIPNYVKDDQTFYENYINEIKPYRTKLRDYLPIYDAVDSSTGDWTDFDLPSRYNLLTGTFASPDITNELEQDLLATKPYSDWTNNYTFKIADYLIGNVGVNYSIAPNVEITGGGGTGAAAITTINPGTGQLTGITVIDPGQGYTSTPTVVINGMGSGAKIYPLLKNEFYTTNSSLSYNLVRSLDTTIKLDRIDYTSANTVIWPITIGTNLSKTVITSGDNNSANIWISSGNIYVYNNDAYILKDDLTVSSLLFDFTLFTKVEASNVLLKATDRISTYYTPGTGMPNKSFPELISGVDYPGVKVKDATFTANSFEISSNIISFNYEGLTITSGNTSQVDFRKEGFEIDQSIRIQSLVPFNFMNNSYYTIISVNSDSMMLTGAPIETTYKMYLSSPVTLNAGAILSQVNNTVANAYVLQSVVNSTAIDIIHNQRGFSEDYANVLTVNGVSTSSYIVDITTGGNANVKVSYLELDTSVLDANIYSKYLDSALGTRPEDINIVGGAYVDTYSSHAPEELVPGHMFDALEMRVFTNNSSNTETYGFRIFEPMSGNVEFTRISANTTTTLAANLSITDTEIFVTDASILPGPGANSATPGVVFINGEKIHYYQKYDSFNLGLALNWTPDTSFLIGSLINIDVATVYNNVSSNVAGITFDVSRYGSFYSTQPNLKGSGQTVGNVYSVGGNQLGGTAGINDLLLTAETLSNPVVGNLAVVSSQGTPVIPTSQTYRVLGDVYANANAYVNTANLHVVYNNSLTQLRRGVDGTGSIDMHLTGSLVSDSSLQQIIPDSAVYANTVANIFSTGNAIVTSNVTWKLTLSSPITANIGDYITQNGNTANARVLGNVTSANVVAVDIIAGNILLTSNTNTRVNLVVGTSFTTTTVNVAAMEPLGTVSANGNVSANTLTGPLLRSNLWIPMGTGAGIEGSTLAGATFIKEEPSYTP